MTNNALTQGQRFLVSRQSPDGAWRSDRYGNFKNGDALTPLALLALLESGHKGEGIARGAAFLANMVRRDGRIDAGSCGLAYPVYAAALTVQALFHPDCPMHEAARQAWLAFLLSRQLTEVLGWTPEDREYGGWGYSQADPVKPPPGEPASALVESNLSATAYALDALHAAGVGPEDEAMQRALRFVPRCQNFGDDPPFDDGGFFFMENDPIRNKAGVAGVDRPGRERYASYGSMTADGLRCLLHCGMASRAPRVQAAYRWLKDRPDVTVNPGAWSRDRRFIQASIHYYYLWSLKRALAAGIAHQVDEPGSLASWLEALVAFVTRQQKPDGSWVNETADVRENEPIVATSLALLILGRTRPP